MKLNLHSSIRKIAVAAILIGCIDAQAEDTLLQGFQNPPQQARPRVWWHWMNGNVTKDGIYKDLMWMQRAGIGGFHAFDAGTVSPQIVEKRLIYMDDGWKDAFAYATHLADSLGMEMAVASAPGWSNTGGPWVSPEQAMKKLTWRTVEVQGKGKEMKIALPEPYRTTGFFQNVPPADNGTEFSTADVNKEWYEDVAVIALRLPEAEISIKDLGAKVTSSGGEFTVDILTDGDLASSPGLPSCNEGAAWIQYEFPKPVTIKAMTVADGKVRNEWACEPAEVLKHLYASDNGKDFNFVCDIPHGGTYQQTIAIPETTARYFRLVVDNPTANALYDAFYGIKPDLTTKVSEWVLYPVAKINHAEEKAGFATPHDMMENLTPNETACAALADVIDVTDKVDSDGVLHWAAPKGNWRIYRFGNSLTGKKNHPAPPEATGLEVSKIDKEAVRDYISHYLDMYADATNGLMGERGLQYLLIDSYEAGWETWCKDMPQQFQARRGYDLMPWMPVLTGQIIGSAERSEQFLKDWRQTIGELISEGIYDEIANAVHDRGMKCYFESHENGRMYLADGMRVKKNSDIPMAAMWALEGAGGANHTMSECDIRESAAIAHLYGQNLVALESFTSNGLANRAYSFAPSNLKPVADLAMSCGVNRFVVHESAHQPVDDKKPGLGLLIFGQWFNRHDTWAEQAHAWTDYLARSSYMLQQGQNVADILYYYGDDNSITGLFANGLPQIPAGYNFDYVNTDALVNDITSRDGQLVAPSGNTYRVLVLDSNATALSPEAEAKIADLERAGVKVVRECKKLAENLNFAPDCNAEGLRFVHRSTPNQEIYWLNNRSNQPKRLTASMRVKGLRPTLWHPETGETEEVSYRQKENGIEVDLSLVANDAVFVVFEGEAQQAYAAPQKVETELQTLAQPWQVNFTDILDGSVTPKTFTSLKSWTENEDPAVKYFSGTASYGQSFDFSKSREGRYVLDLGEVGDIAEVFLNGHNCGTLWKAPYRVDITDALAAGHNDIVIRVTNKWANRLIGEKIQGISKAFAAFDFFNEESPLHPSGLMSIPKISLITEKYSSIRPGQEWLDTNGNPIQAHGFSVVYDDKDECYYWFGEDKERTVEGSNVWTYGVRCYRSTDFYNWEDMGHIIMPDTTDVHSPLHFSQGLDRPHIIHNPRSNKWVCWIKNLSDETQFYTILQSDNFTGPYEIVKPAYKPNGYEGGDFDLYVDENSGKAYIWWERPHWELMTAELNDDFTGVTDKMAHNYVGQIPPNTREAPTHFMRNGKHYLFSSGTSGYFPNESLVSTFEDYLGEYKSMGNPHPSDSSHTSFFSQITEVIKVPGKKDLYVALADRWMPQIVGTDAAQGEWKRIAGVFEGHQPHAVTFEPIEIMDRSSIVRTDWDVTNNARYVWLPIRFDGDMPVIEWKDEWKLEDYE